MKTFDNFDLKNASWVKIGGNAKKYVEVESSDEFKDLVVRLIKDEKKFDVFGLGANTLFSDDGLDSEVIKVKSNEIKVLEDFVPSKDVVLPGREEKRHTSFKSDKVKTGFDTEDLDYDEPDAEDIFVYLDSGVTLSYAINDLITRGITGLSFFSGIPGTVGGALFNNIHGGPRLLSEFVYSADVINKQGETTTLTSPEIEFGYNLSRFQKEDLIITGGIFKLKLGDKDRARKSSIEWTRRKATQPKNSLGSVFHNLTPEIQEKLGYPTPSIAYVIEHVLDLSGYRVGGIMIPEQYPPEHVQLNKNIFMNVENGTASDFIAVMRKVSDEMYEKLGFRPKAEIFFKGFDPEEISIFK